MVPLVAVTFAATAGAVALATPARADVAECELTYSITRPPWEGGFQAEVRVRNVGSTPTTRWVAMVALQWGTGPVSVWGASEPSRWPGTVMYFFSNAPYNGTLAPGQETTFGFLASGADSTPLGTTCSVMN